MSQSDGNNEAVAPPTVPFGYHDHAPKASKHPGMAGRQLRPLKRRKLGEEHAEDDENTPASPSQLPDPYAHLRPPFENFWSEEPYPPFVPSPEIEREVQEGPLYFAYGKDMDLAYLSHLFSAEPAFIGIAKLAKHRWVIEESGRFPMVVEMKEGEGEVYGMVYGLSQVSLDVMKKKVEKRGLRFDEMEVEILEKSGGLPGFWSTPLTPIGSTLVHVMIGALGNGEHEGMLEGSKRQKVLGGLLWGASEGLPEHWKEGIRAKLGGVTRLEDRDYWLLDGEKRKSGVKKANNEAKKRGDQTGEEGGDETGGKRNDGVRRSSRLNRKGKRVCFAL